MPAHLHCTRQQSYPSLLSLCWQHRERKVRKSRGSAAQDTWIDWQNLSLDYQPLLSISSKIRTFKKTEEQ